MSDPINDKFEPNRRDFLLAAAAATACACALCPAALGQKKDDDDDDIEELPKVPVGPVDVGTAGDFPKDGIYDKFAKARHLLMIRQGGKLFALTAVCSHKGVLLKEKDGKVFCPQHNSRFTPEGVPAPKPSGTMGPAKKELIHFAIATNAKGRVIVDTAKPIEQPKWNDASAFVKV